MGGKWVMVPDAPTDEMCAAGWIDKEDVAPAEIYRAMIAARPAAPAQEDDLIEWLLDADKLTHISHAELIAGCKRAADALAAAQRRLVEMRWALRNMRTAAICFEAVAPEDDAIQDIREELVEAFVQSSALAARPAAPAGDTDGAVIVVAIAVTSLLSALGGATVVAVLWLAFG
jgi:hypothetical protein